MTWRTVYDEATGGDVANGGYLSSGTVVTDPLPRGLASKVETGPPQQEQWNTTTLEWEPIPTPPPDVDRADEVIVAIKAVQPMNGRVEDAVRAEVEKVLGDVRMRDSEEPYEIEIRRRP